MKSVLVKMKDADEVKELNHILNGFDCNFDLLIANNRIDAKSLLGMFALQFNTTMELVIHTDGQMLDRVEDSIKKYIVKAVS